jgi:hypothetical protein
MHGSMPSTGSGSRLLFAANYAPGRQASAAVRADRRRHDIHSVLRTQEVTTAAQNRGVKSGVIFARASTNVSGGLRTSIEAACLGSMDITGRSWRWGWGAISRSLSSPRTSGFGTKTPELLITMARLGLEPRTKALKEIPKFELHARCFVPESVVNETTRDCARAFGNRMIRRNISSWRNRNRR